MLVTELNGNYSFKNCVKNEIIIYLNAYFLIPTDKSYIETAEELLKKNANPTLEYPFGDTVWHKAAFISMLNGRVFFTDHDIIN